MKVVLVLVIGSDRHRKTLQCEWNDPLPRRIFLGEVPDGYEPDETDEADEPGKLSPLFAYPGPYGLSRDITTGVDYVVYTVGALPPSIEQILIEQDWYAEPAPNWLFT